MANADMGCGKKLENEQSKDRTWVSVFSNFEDIPHIFRRSIIIFKDSLLGVWASVDNTLKKCNKCGMLNNYFILSNSQLRTRVMQHHFFGCSTIYRHRHVIMLLS